MVSHVTETSTLTTNRGHDFSRTSWFRSVAGAASWGDRRLLYYSMVQRLLNAAAAAAPAAAVNTAAAAAAAAVAAAACDAAGDCREEPPY